MALLPYCTFLAGEAELPRTGIEDRVVLKLDLDGLLVIYSDLGTHDFGGEKFKGAALRFHEVVYEVFEQRAVIPFRFPTFLTEKELRDHLRKESEHYLGFLHTHTDDVQMEVRLWRDDTARPKPAGGTEYMMRLLEHHMLREQAAREVQDLSAHLVREWREDESREEIRLFALISRKHVGGFRERLAERVVDQGHIHTRVTGPWPATEFFPGSARRMPHNVVSITGGDKP